MQAVIFDLDTTLFGGEQGALRDGVADLLHILRRLGVRMGAVTAGDHRMLVRLNEAGIRHLFDSVVCADHVAAPKETEGVTCVLKHMGLEAQHAAFVSHNHQDIAAGKGAGVAKTIHITHGTSAGADRVAADHVVEDVPAILDVLE